MNLNRPIGRPSCQAPGTSEQEREYAWKKFGFEFPVMDKIAVKDKPGTCKGVDPSTYEEFKAGTSTLPSTSRLHLGCSITESTQRCPTEELTLS
jgi:hypothetical protein